MFFAAQLNVVNRIMYLFKAADNNYKLNNLYKHKRFIIFFILVCFQLPYPSYSNNLKDGCYRNAMSWIEEIEIEDATALENHALSNCKSSKNWIDRYGNTGSNRTRLCNDLVLISTHKECMYFRDYVSHTAYDPCKSWSREMYKRCMDYDDEWFAN